MYVSVELYCIYNDLNFGITSIRTWCSCLLPVCKDDFTRRKRI